MDTQAIQDMIMVRCIGERQLAQACALPLERVRQVVDGDDCCPYADVQRVCAVLGLSCDLTVRCAGCT